MRITRRDLAIVVPAGIAITLIAYSLFVGILTFGVPG